MICLLFSLSVPALSADHGQYISGTFLRGTDVTKFCLTCHEEEAQDFIRTSHWKWKGPPNGIVGMEVGSEELGKINLINNFCISVEGGSKVSNKESCSACHAGYGLRDASFDFGDVTRVDCLVCHADPKVYRKGNAGEAVFMVEGYEDVLFKRAIRSVTAPRRENCGVCHFFGGGGDGVKHGDLGSFLKDPGRESDVHMGPPLNMTCQSCHVTRRHRIAGASTFLATNEGRVSCAKCHSGTHERSSRRKEIELHGARVACQSCHIPRFARTQPTKMAWDWSQVGTDRKPETQYGRETFLRHKGAFEGGMNVVPTYAWDNGKITRYLKGDVIEDPSKAVYISRPSGSIGDLSSRIHPFKVHRARQPMDKRFRYLLVPHLYKGLWDHLDWEAALREGAAGADMEFSGSFEFITTLAFGAINHEVAPKEEALSCDECHGESGRIDWRALGYGDGDPSRPGGQKAP
ncbi:MAG: tetrathionate reductase family octaheme c-type cytochrome [Thermodesulfovibrionales bacterium]